jgi:hypothetical protein
MTWNCKNGMKDKVRIVKTTSENPDFVNLISALDKSLWERYPELKSDYWEIIFWK